MMCLMDIATMGERNGCYRNKTSKKGYVNLGLPSGTQWKASHETNSNNGDEFFTYDEAVAKFGKKLPTKEQIEELVTYCKWEWQDSGYKVTGPNGNFIILPALGYRNCNGDVSIVGSFGFYWSSTPRDVDDAWNLFFYSGNVNMFNNNRNNGQSVWLVQE